MVSIWWIVGAVVAYTSLAVVVNYVDYKRNKFFSGANKVGMKGDI